MFINSDGKHSKKINHKIQTEMEIFTTKIVDMVKSAKLFASQGGPIIFAQVFKNTSNILFSYFMYLLLAKVFDDFLL